MTIQDRNLTAGDEAWWPGTASSRARCEVVVRDGGKLGYRLEERPGVQEPVVGRDRHHRQVLQRLGLLEHGRTSTAPAGRRAETPTPQGR